MQVNMLDAKNQLSKLVKAAVSGEEVIIETREGNLRLVADTPSGSTILGCMKAQLLRIDDDVVSLTTTADEWDPAE